MKKVKKRESIRFYLVLGAIYFVIWITVEVSGYHDTLFPRLINNTWRIIYVIGLNYLLYEYLLPYIFLKRKNILYNILSGIVITFLFLMLCSFGLYTWRSIGIDLNFYTIFPPFNTRRITMQALAGYSMGSVLFFGVARHFYYYFKLKQAASQLRIEKQHAELSYLKSQTNPHFLFNTLNNIYSLTRDKSDLAPESVLRLSKMLRFMLYETSGEFIALEEEIKIITDYIELEKLRYDESLQVTFNTDVENMKQSLPPLLLVPLVENAFKHGVSETRKIPFVNIHLSVKNKILLFDIKNSVDEAWEIAKEKIGLSNLRRQLELQYKDYNLTLNKNGSVFTVSLKINLSSHV